MQITLTPSTLAAFAKVLDCRKALLLSGYNAYIDQQASRLAVQGLDLLMQDNPDATGLARMTAEVEAEIADENGEFALHREALAIERDLHNNHNKADKAHLAQTLAALRLQMNDKSGFFA